ncbi:MAG: glyceraldehyde 3-phosphate dehydrogenase NAD-binding domain-containing protein, partial [Patescibacteria group bacterium]
MIKVAINGFGRIGALFTRAYLENWRGQFKLVAINASGTSGNMSPEDVARRLKHDSNYGNLNELIVAFPDSIVYFPKSEGVENVGDGGRIKILGEPDAEKLPWKELGVDIVIDCTGELLTAEKAEKHLKAGAKKVILSAPPKDENIPMFVYGVNHSDYKPKMKIISNASCTTNALAPLVKIISEKWQII